MSASTSSAADMLTPNQLFAEIRDFIRQARQMAEDGAEPDLQGLDEKVKMMVTQIQQMPVEQFGKLQPQLEGLTAELDELKASLQQQKGQVEEAINDLPNQQKAHNAYQQARITGEQARNEERTAKKDKAD